MALKYGFGFFRPSVLLSLASVLVLSVFVPLIIIAPKEAIPNRTSVLLNPMTYMFAVASVACPNSVFFALDIFLAMIFDKYVSIGMLIVAFLFSVPFSLWVMSSVIQEGNTEDLKPKGPYSLAMRELLQNPVYRLLNLFRYVPMYVAAPNIWAYFFVDTSAVLAHTCALKLGFQWLRAVMKGESFGFLRTTALTVLFSSGIVSMFIIESRARQIVMAHEAEMDKEGSIEA